jgi:hypothetical protein
MIVIRHNDCFMENWAATLTVWNWPISADHQRLRIDANSLAVANVRHHNLSYWS